MSLKLKLLLVVLFFAILPFFILSFYAAPNLEDYAESIIPNVWWHIKFLYLTYDGRYFTSFLFAALNPLKIKSYFLYKCIPWFLMFGLFLSFYHLSLTFINKSKKLAFLFGGLILFLFLNRNPNIPYTLYYMISTYVYMVTSVLFLLLISSSYKVLTSKRNNIYAILFVCFSILAVAGGVELLLIPTIVWFLFLTYLNIRLTAGKGKEICLFWLTITCAYFTVFTSPGVNENLNIVGFDEELIIILKSISNSILFTAFHIKNWLSGNYTLLICSLLFIHYLKHNRVISSLDLTLVQKLSLASFLIISLFFIVFPYTWSTRETATADYTQVFIIPYLFFTVFWFFIIFLFTSQTKTHDTSQAIFKKESLFIVLLLLLVVSVSTDNNSNVKIAYQDLWNKDAHHYYEEIRQNIQKSEKDNQVLNKDKQVVLCELNHRPRSLYSGVYFTKGEEHFHLQYRLFYDVKKLKVEKCL